jgi:SAM-dependent methyltransferase
MPDAVRQRFKHLAARLARPSLQPLYERMERLEGSVDRLAASVEVLAASVLDREKHREELGYWRWLFKTPEGRASHGGTPPEELFRTWQRDRLRELGAALGLDSTVHAGAANGTNDAALDGWCAEQSAIEIGAGPYPALAAAPRWKRAVAVDPLARAYGDELILPAAADHIVYIEASGERIPLAAGFADLVIIENALDHVSDPGAVLAEIRRLLRDDGLLWLLVDLSNYSDHMHPHPFNEERVRSLLAQAGFEPVRDRVSDHKSHPKAYGEYRGLLRKPARGRMPALPPQALRA